MHAFAGGASHSKGYRRIRIDGGLYYEHRLSVLYMTGEWPDDQVDHENGEGTENWWDNLRDATGAQNQANRGPNRNNKVGLKGVSERDDRYEARIMANGTETRLGTFDTPEEAHAHIARQRRNFTANSQTPGTPDPRPHPFFFPVPFNRRFAAARA